MHACECEKVALPAGLDLHMRAFAAVTLTCSRALPAKMVTGRVDTYAAPSAMLSSACFLAVGMLMTFDI